MRTTLLAFAGITVAAPAFADIITENGTPIRSNNSEYQAALIYSFAPISIPGNVTAISLTYVGSVVPGIYGFGYSQLISYSLTPFAQIENTDVPVNGGYSAVYVNPIGPTASGASVTVINGQTPPITIGSPITVSNIVTVNSSNLTGLTTGPISFQVAGYTVAGNYVYPTGAIGSVQPLADASSVNAGRLTLSVSYDPITVPEPMSIALLGVGLMATLLARRRA